MNTSEKVKILSMLATRNEAGKHFSEIYAAADLAALENDGLITIHRPVHEATGITYSPEYSSVEVTSEGVELVEANPEDCA